MCRFVMCASVESAVGFAGRESAETESQGAGAERHEEDDGGDEGWSAVLYFMSLHRFCKCPLKYKPY